MQIKSHESIRIKCDLYNFHNKTVDYFGCVYLLYKCETIRLLFIMSIRRSYKNEFTLKH